MAISENTVVSIKAGALVSAVVAIVWLTWQAFTYRQESIETRRRLEATEHRLVVARSWLYVMRYPEDTWSRNYAANHNFLED